MDSTDSDFSFEKSFELMLEISRIVASTSTSNKRNILTTVIETYNKLESKLSGKTVRISLAKVPRTTKHIEQQKIILLFIFLCETCYRDEVYPALEGKKYRLIKAEHLKTFDCTKKKSTTIYPALIYTPQNNCVCYACECHQKNGYPLNTDENWQVFFDELFASVDSNNDYLEDYPQELDSYITKQVGGCGYHTPMGHYYSELLKNAKWNGYLESTIFFQLLEGVENTNNKKRLGKINSRHNSKKWFLEVLKFILSMEYNQIPSNIEWILNLSLKAIKIPIDNIKKCCQLEPIFLYRVFKRYISSLQVGTNEQILIFLKSYFRSNEEFEHLTVESSIPANVLYMNTDRGGGCKIWFNGKSISITQNDFTAIDQMKRKGAVSTSELKKIFDIGEMTDANCTINRIHARLNNIGGKVHKIHPDTPKRIHVVNNDRWSIREDEAVYIFVDNQSPELDGD